MSARPRGLPKDAVLPNDPKWVVIESSDGDARRWPTNTTSNPDSEGHVNYMQPLSIENGQAVKWRMIIGQALAEMHGYPDLESKSWVLKDWPVGYQFYDHNKGQLDGIVRHDLYLVGSDSVARFRSPAEFIPHAYWLMTDSTRDRYNCACKYCAKKPQREISDAFGLSQRQGGSPSLAHFADLPRADRNSNKRRRALPAREGRVFATVRRAPKPVKLPKGPKQHVNPEREKDLRAALGPKTLGERRWAREGELVWVKLDHPIPVVDRDIDSEKITFWPGMIEEVLFKAEITPKWVGDKVTGDGSCAGSKMGVPPDPKGEDVDPWTIVHRSIYKIKLLVASKTVIYGSDHILPYQSHAPDNNLLTEVQAIVFDLNDVANELGEMVLPSDSQQEQPEKALFKRFESFDPFPVTQPLLTQVEDRRHYFETAAGAFAVAIQIASRLTMYWTPSDEWEYKLQMPLTSHVSTDVWSATRNALSPAEQHTLSQRVLGTQHANIGMHTTQVRFQGLWWGPERIWMGDLVRLKLARYQLAAEGTETIKKPSGAGKSGLLESKDDSLKQLLSSPSGQNSTSAHVDSEMRDVDISLPNGNSSITNGADTEIKREDAIDVHDLGASSRSVFLRIDGLFVVHVLREDGQGVENECRMCGMLYELADDDWEADDEEFGDGLPSTDLTVSEEAKTSHAPPSSSGGVTMTPLRNLVPSKVGPTLADVINDSASRLAPPPPPPPSSSLFAPNPDLLSEPPVQADVSMTQAAQTEVVDPLVEPLSAGPSVGSLPPSSTIYSPTETKDEMNATDSSAPKTEASAPSNPSLSGPLKAAESVYPTPPPPSSMKFRPILRDGYEVVIPLTMLAGRYYPGLLSNVLLHSRVQAALQNPHARESKAIRALEGFVAGALNSVDAMHFLPRRGQMMREAESVAWRELVSYWQRRVSEKENAIVVDDD